MTILLTDREIKSFPIPKVKHKIYWDSRITGLGIRITNNDSRSFVLRYVIKGRERKYTIGGYPALSCSAARNIANELKGDIARGIDPLEERFSVRGVPTFEEVAQDFLKSKEKTLRSRTLQDYKKYFLERYLIKKFGKLKIDSITKKDIEIFHSSFSNIPRTGNRIISIMLSLFNKAISWDLIQKNPCVGIKKFTEHKRERYLSEEEILVLLKVLDKSPNQINANIIRLILFTGSRKSEVLSARWKDFDLENAIWTKPSFLTKQNKSSRIPLNDRVVAILNNMKKEHEYLFFNKQTGNHILDIKRFWKYICKEANIKDIHIHDLRHSFASILVNEGESLEVIGKLLGHSDIKTTQRYSHLYDKNLRKATDKFSSKFMI